MLKSILLFLVLFTPPANGHIDLAREYDDSYTSEVDPYAPRGLKNSYLSSVIIHSINEENFTGIGSGNYFKLGSHRFVITAAHVVSENTERDAAASTQTIRGPRGTYMEFQIQSSLDLNTGTFLFTELGSTTTVASTSVYYIDTTVRITGATTGYRIDIPVRFVRKV